MRGGTGEISKTRRCLRLRRLEILNAQTVMITCCPFLAIWVMTDSRLGKQRKFMTIGSSKVVVLVSDPGRSFPGHFRATSASDGCNTLGQARLDGRAQLPSLALQGGLE